MISGRRSVLQLARRARRVGAERASGLRDAGLGEVVERPLEATRLRQPRLHRVQRRVDRAVEHESRARELRELLGVLGADAGCRRSSRRRSASRRPPPGGRSAGRGPRRGCRRWRARRGRRGRRTAARSPCTRPRSAPRPAGDGVESRSARSASISAVLEQSIVGSEHADAARVEPDQVELLGHLAVCRSGRRAPAGSSTPEPPGPPGSVNSEPIRAAGSSAFCRSIAIWAILPSGCA